MFNSSQFFIHRFKFPAVFVVYEMIPLGMFEISLLIGYTNRTKLFCKSQNLAENVFESSTFYCNFQGTYIFPFNVKQNVLSYQHINNTFNPLSINEGLIHASHIAMFSYPVKA